MESQHHFQGNLAADPAQRVVANGMRVTRFRIACSGRRFDRATSEWVSTDPLYISVVCWRQLGDNVMQTLRKGDSVVVIGRMTYREYDDPNNGARRSVYEVEAQSIGPDLSRYVAMLARPTRELTEVAEVPEQPAAADAQEPAAA